MQIGIQIKIVAASQNALVNGHQRSNVKNNWPWTLWIKSIQATSILGKVLAFPIDKQSARKKLISVNRIITSDQSRKHQSDGDDNDSKCPCCEKNQLLTKCSRFEAMP